MTPRKLLFSLCIISLAVSFSGCVATDEQPEPADEAPVSDATSAELFQKRSDQSMMEAALARWREGDVTGCRMLLERLLGRSPNHLQARFLLADLHSSQGDVAAAEAQLRWIIQHNPQNPQAQHSLGMLLETSGRRPEAIAHLQAAAQLEPDNMLYSMCQHAAMSGTTAAIPAPANLNGGMVTAPR